jgi:predicted cupin superfamily sugar epimerase
MTAGAQKMIARLNLAPLPGEGGFYRRTWLSADLRPDGRPAGSQIWYLMTPESFSALHRLDAPERWEFQAGDPIEHVQLDPRDGTLRVQTLGHNTRRSLVVSAGVWQGARLAVGPHPRGWALLACSMSPAWDEKGFELGRRDDLLGVFPTAASLISVLTR